MNQSALFFFSFSWFGSSRDISPSLISNNLPPVLDQELPDEALGQLAGVTEELVVKVVVHGRDVAQRLLLGVAEERRRAAQAEKTTSDTQPPVVLFQVESGERRHLQDVGDDSDAPVGKRRKQDTGLITTAVDGGARLDFKMGLTTCQPPVPVARS